MASEGGGFNWGAFIGAATQAIRPLFGGSRSPHQVQRKLARYAAAQNAAIVARQAAAPIYSAPLPGNVLGATAGPRVYAAPQQQQQPQQGPVVIAQPSTGSGPLDALLLALQVALPWLSAFGVLGPTSPKHPPGSGRAARASAGGPVTAGMGIGSSTELPATQPDLLSSLLGPQPGYTPGDVGVATFAGGIPTGAPLNIQGVSVMPSVSMGSIFGSLASGALTALGQAFGGGAGFNMAMPGGAPLMGIAGPTTAAGLPATTQPSTLFGMGTRARGPSVVMVGNRAYRALGQPIAWSGDLAAVRRLRRAAKRINRVIPHRRSGGRRFR